MHIEVENQFLFKVRKSLVVFQLLNLPSGLYNLVSFPVRNIIRRPWNLPIQLIPEISLNPLRRAESSKFLRSLWEKWHKFIVSNPCLKKFFCKERMKEDITFPSFLYETLQI